MDSAVQGEVDGIGERRIEALPRKRRTRWRPSDLFSTLLPPRRRDTTGSSRVALDVSCHLSSKWTAFGVLTISAPSVCCFSPRFDEDYACCAFRSDHVRMWVLLSTFCFIASTISWITSAYCSEQAGDSAEGKRVKALWGVVLGVVVKWKFREFGFLLVNMMF